MIVHYWDEEEKGLITYYSSTGAEYQGVKRFCEKENKPQQDKIENS